MSTYRTYVNTFYPVIVVLEDVKTEVRTTCKFNVEFINGKIRLSPVGSESQIENFSEGELSISGSSVYATFPQGKKVISVDVSGLPGDIASVGTADGGVELPSCGVYVKKPVSNGKGLTEDQI
jgi:hypothetical protein